MLFGNDSGINVSNNIERIGNRVSKRDDRELSCYAKNMKLQQLSYYKRCRIEKNQKAYTSKRITKVKINTKNPKQYYKIRSKRSNRKSIRCIKIQLEILPVIHHRRSACRKAKKIDTRISHTYASRSSNYTTKHHVWRSHHQ
jgi:hypothetical protein